VTADARPGQRLWVARITNHRASMKARGVRLALALAVVCSACAPPEGPSPRDAGSPPAASPQTLMVGALDPLDPARLDPATSVPADLSCLDTPVLYTGAPAPIAALVYERWTGLGQAGWCLAITQQEDPGPIDCDPRRDPVSVGVGLLDPVDIGPGPLWAVAVPSAELVGAARTATGFRVETVGLGGTLQLGVVTGRVARLQQLSGATAATARTLWVRVLDCTGRPMAGAQVALVGHTSAPQYGDVFPSSPRRASTGGGGHAWFVELPEVDAVLVRVSGRVAASEPPAVVGCARVAVPAATQVELYVEPRRLGDPDCEGDP